MIYPSMDKLENWGSKYALVTLAAKRAKQLKSGAPPLVETDSRNPLTVALEEIAAGKITCFVPDVDLVVSASVEPEVAQLLAIPMEPEEELAEEETAAAGVETAVIDEEVAEEEEEEEEEEEHDEWVSGLVDEVAEEDRPLAHDEEDVPAVDVEAPIDGIAAAPDEEAAPKPKRRGRAKKTEDIVEPLETPFSDSESEESSEESDEESEESDY